MILSVAPRRKRTSGGDELIDYDARQADDADEMCDESVAERHELVLHAEQVAPIAIVCVKLNKTAHLVDAPIASPTASELGDSGKSYPEHEPGRCHYAPIQSAQSEKRRSVTTPSVTLPATKKYFVTEKRRGQSAAACR